MRILPLLKARLSQRIAVWVMVSIFIIEAIIIVPSYMVRQRDLLYELEQLGFAKASFIVALMGSENMGEDPITAVRELADKTIMAGGVIYDLEGEMLVAFGETPGLTYADLQDGTVVKSLSEDGRRYDVAWPAARLPEPYYFVARLNSSHVGQELSEYAWRIIGFILLISAFVTTATMIGLGKTVILPILRLRDSLLAVGNRQMLTLPVDRNDELGDVMTAFNQMATQIEERTTDLIALTEELQAANQQLQTLNDRFQSELALAQRIQQSLLPAPRPNWASPILRCYSAPVRAVGGDFYDYYESSTGIYALTVGDVSGKGMPAALLMSMSLASFREVVRHKFPPAMLLARLNGMIAPYTHTIRQNCALVYVELKKLDHDSTRLRAANAGCIAPIIRRRDGSVEWVDVFGLPLGVELGQGLGYEVVETTLQPGDLVLLTSDGVVEAQNANAEMFGFDRLEEAIREGPPEATDMLAHLQEQVEQFVGEEESHDDITMVVAQV